MTTPQTTDAAADEPRIFQRLGVIERRLISIDQHLSDLRRESSDATGRRLDRIERQLGLALPAEE